MSTRTRITITVVAAIAAIAALIPLGLSAFRQMNRPPVLITMPPGAPSTSAPSVDSSESHTSSANPTPSLVGTIYVHIAGAVRHPDVYQMPLNSRVFEALKVAGGALQNADKDDINLAEPLHDGEKIYIPTIGQADQQVARPAGTGNELGHASMSGEPQTTSGSKQKNRSSGRSDKLTSPSQGQVDINTADVDELQKLPGVGPAMAARIVAARQSLTHFRRPEDLLEVTGIGPKKFNKLRSFVKV